MRSSTMSERKKDPHDEYYTRYDDIQTELNHYESQLRGKTILCNCDDPYESNFCKFFLRNFNYLGLKRLICTSYESSPIIGSDMPLFDFYDQPVTAEHGYVMDITEVPMSNGRGVSDVDIDNLLHSKNISIKRLEGDGDFRSDECIKYLKQADIVVTNPPFSLLDEYFPQLLAYEKKFLILSSPNVVHYKEVFPRIMSNEIWAGYKPWNDAMLFHVSENLAKWLVENKKKGSAWVIQNGEILGRTQAVWFTNLDVKKRHEKLFLFKQYDPEVYPTYLNYDAIDVVAPTQIPCDYYGKMGVPDSFLAVYNPDQFEILGLAESDMGKALGISANLTKEQRDALFREYKSFRAGNPILRKKDGQLHKPFARMIIRRKGGPSDEN